MASQEVPALLLGNGITALGAMRSLQRAGISVYCAAPTPDVEAWSRWYRPLPFTHKKAPEQAADSELLEEFLESLPFERAVLFACSDHWLKAVAALPERLKTRFSTSAPEWEVQRLFLDKELFGKTVERVGVPHPKTYSVDSESDLKAVLKNNPIEDFFLKPRDSQSFFRRYQTKGHFPSSVEDALQCFRQLEAERLKVVLQEFVPGGADHHYYVEGFVDERHRMHSVFARQRLRMHPPKLGNSTAMVSIDAARVRQAVEDLARLFEQVRFRGIFSAEFKWDARESLFKVLEVNIRPWWYIEFAAIHGINVASMAYHDALGLALPIAREYPTGIVSVNMYYDWQVLRNDPERNLGKCAAVLHSWLFGYRTVFSLHDPLPAVQWFGQQLKRQQAKIATAYGTFLGRVTPSPQA